MLDYSFLYIISIPMYICFLMYWIYKKDAIFSLVWRTIFYFYCISVIAIVFFPIPISSTQWVIVREYIKINVIPFQTIISQIWGENLPLIIKIKQILGNILLFVPLGVFIKYFYQKFSVLKIIYICMWFSISIEILQLLIGICIWYNYRVIDIDDILLNTLWWYIGYFLYYKGMRVL